MVTPDDVESRATGTAAVADDASAAGEPPALEGLEERLGHRFGSRALLEKALQHASYANETPGAESNERLEFLGDAVIGIVVATLLYDAKPGWQEGDLTRALSRLVDRRSLSEQARTLGAIAHELEQALSPEQGGDGERERHRQREDQESSAAAPVASRTAAAAAPQEPAHQRHQLPSWLRRTDRPAYSPASPSSSSRSS